MSNNSAILQKYLGFHFLLGRVNFVSFIKMPWIVMLYLGINLDLNILINILVLFDIRHLWHILTIFFMFMDKQFNTKHLIHIY